MAQTGDIVEFNATQGTFTQWRCQLGSEPKIEHRDETVRVILGELSLGGENFKRSQCLKHPNHYGNVSFSRVLTNGSRVR